MSKLKQLIDELCPDGVEYVETEKIKKESFWLMPATPAYTDSGIPYITSKNVKKGAIDFNDVKYISEKDFEVISTNRKVEKNDMLITMIGTIGEVAFVSGITKFYGQNLFLIRFNETIVDKKYYYYYLTSEKIKNALVSKKNASSQGYIKAGNIENLQIPLPPLPVQREIVRILDKFTELTVELTVELTARKKQYEYYRDSLLAFGDEVPMVPLGEFATIVRGGNFQKKDFTGAGVPCIHYGQIYTKYGLSLTEAITFIDQTAAKKSKFASKNDIVMAVTSENVEDVCKCVVWLGEGDVAISGHTAIIKHSQNSKFLAYYFHTSMFFRSKIKLAHGTKVIEVTPSKLADIKIPVPSLPEQQRIVDILDCFDTLCNDISSGLPAEIKARQQQYEYYRDKLLTFKKLDVKV